MSKFSGKCDLYDHMMMLVTRESGNCYVSDELECFEEFKKRTKGILYQHHKILVTEQNQNFVKDHCDGFVINTHTISKPDKRLKEGQKICEYYSYEYYGKQYKTLKELNKHGVYITTEIKFTTLLDLIPYYPYIITCMFSDKDSSKVIISNESFVKTEFKSHLQYGYISGLDYNKVLQNHYKDVVLRYFNPDGRYVTETIDIKPDIDLTHIQLGHAIDYQWDIEVIRDHYATIWCSPKIVDADAGIIDISQVWPNTSIPSITLKYVKKNI